MNILFLTLLNIESINERTIYTDLLRGFVRRGDSVYIVSPIEKGLFCDPFLSHTRVISEDGCRTVRPYIGRMQKTGPIEKGLGMLTLGGRLKRAIGTSLSDVRFDLIIYSTPPVTLAGVIGYIKRRDGAQTYLLLRDIFPQNAVDLGMMSTHGPASVIWRYFRNKERKLYALSDRIGCMSPANVAYLLAHNPDIEPSRVGICPNCIEVRRDGDQPEDRLSVRKRYSLPADRKIFVYGGNIGRPQGVRHIIECLKAVRDMVGVFFLIVGSGTDFGLLESFVADGNSDNVRLMHALPREEYDNLVTACDAGLIFLDNRFTIPNFPSRLLGYMQAGLPVLAVCDRVSDVGGFLEENGVGVDCPADDVGAFRASVTRLCDSDIPSERVLCVLSDNFDAGRCCDIIRGRDDK